jgi:hypothetical protein
MGSFLCDLPWPLELTLHFAAFKLDEKRSALVKLRLCRSCSKKLQYQRSLRAGSSKALPPSRINGESPGQSDKSAEFDGSNVPKSNKPIKRSREEKHVADREAKKKKLEGQPGQSNSTQSSFQISSQEVSPKDIHSFVNTLME